MPCPAINKHFISALSAYYADYIADIALFIKFDIEIIHFTPMRHGAFERQATSLRLQVHFQRSQY